MKYATLRIIIVFGAQCHDWSVAYVDLMLKHYGIVLLSVESCKSLKSDSEKCVPFLFLMLLFKKWNRFNILGISKGI